MPALLHDLHASIRLHTAGDDPLPLLGPAAGGRQPPQPGRGEAGAARAHRLGLWRRREAVEPHVNGMN